MTQLMCVEMGDVSLRIGTGIGSDSLRASAISINGLYADKSMKKGLRKKIEMQVPNVSAGIDFHTFGVPASKCHTDMWQVVCLPGIFQAGRVASSGGLGRWILP